MKNKNMFSINIGGYIQAKDEKEAFEKLGKYLWSKGTKPDKEFDPILTFERINVFKVETPDTDKCIPEHHPV